MANPKHATLVATTVATVTLDADYPMVEVTNVDGAAIVYFTVDGSTPAVAADGSNVLAAAAGQRRELRVKTSGNTVVKLISSGTPKVSARGFRP